MPRFLNISTYKFARLSNLKPLRETLLADCKAWGLKGTILLSTEGINLFVAGAEREIHSLLEKLRAIPGLETLTPKISESDHQPFSRMLVRIKKEIIAFGVEGIDPATRTSPKLPPKELKKWLDEGRDITLLDTRNDYEIKLGTFKNALPIGVNHFRDFPKAVSQLPADLKEKTVVMFCTGGIRCEKAGPYMESQGFKNIFQLDGGILKYFEECNSEHYDGNCFVFDKRVGVDPTLQETPDKMCFACLAPLTPEEISDSRFIEGKSCPYCFKKSDEQMRELIAQREKKIEEVTRTLPGAEPYANMRPLKVPERCDGKTLVEFVSAILKHVAPEWWEKEIKDGNFVNEDRQTLPPTHIVRAGERYYHLAHNHSEPEVNPKISIRYEDGAVIVLEKPAPLPVHPCGRYNRNTLQYILDKVYAPAHPRPAHRLDAGTSGLMVVAKTKHVASLLQPQFSRGEVQKKYHALVQGHPKADEFSCDLPISDTPGVGGGRTVDGEGLPSLTKFKVLERRPDGTALLEAEPVTGRTNQIRVHLWQLGFPICNDPLYLPGQKLGRWQTVEPTEAPMGLQARSIAFTHPLTKERMQFHV